MASPAINQDEGIAGRERQAGEPAPNSGLMGKQPHIAAPTFVSNPTADFKEVTYTDPYGRTGVSQGNTATGEVVRGPRVTFNAGPLVKKPDPPPATSTIVRPNPVIVDPGPVRPTVDPKVDEPKVLGVKLSTVGTLLGVGLAASSAVDLATAGGVNTGMFAGVATALDTAAAGAGGATALFSTPGYDRFGDALTATSGPGAAGGKITFTDSAGWGMVGGTVATLLGLGTKNMVLDTVASVAGGVIGGAIGGAIGGSATLAGFTVAAGTIGAFVGGFALVVIAGMLMPKPSANAAWGAWDPVTKEFKSESDPRKRSPDNEKFIGDYYGIVRGLQDDMVKNYGGNFDNMGSINVGAGNRAGRSELDVSIGDRSVPGGATSTRNFGSDTAGSIEFIGKESVRLMAGLGGDLATAQKNMDYNQPLPMVLGDMNFARDFQKVSTAMISGTMALDLPKAEAIEAVNAWVARATKVGLDTITINKASQTALANINAKST